MYWRKSQSSVRTFLSLPVLSEKEEIAMRRRMMSVLLSDCHPRYNYGSFKSLLAKMTSVRNEVIQVRTKCSYFGVHSKSMVVILYNMK